MKTHFATKHNGPACGRPAKRVRENVRETDCSFCMKTEVYVEAKAASDAAYKPQFGKPLVCECGSGLFRYKGRESYGHYEVYKCAECGTETSRMTETGMSF